MNDSLFVGQFPLVEGKRIIRALEEAGIAYEMAFDDEDIKRLTPSDIFMRGGTAGLGCKVSFFVDPELSDAVQAVFQRLFPV